jgi:threonine/homoserine/homoserine lactone efflux protein
MTGRLLAFAGFSLLLALTPGPDFALVTRNALAFGRRGVVLTTAGLTGGIAIWVAASAVGVAVLLERSAALYTAVRLAGAAYLAYLGIRTLWASRRHPPPLSSETPPASRRASTIWRQGLLSAALNPKLGVFFVSVLPQFVDTHSAALPQSLLLGAIFIVIGIAWMGFYGMSVTRLRDVLMSVRVRRWLERATGVALLAFSAKLVLDAR